MGAVTGLTCAWVEHATAEQEIFVLKLLPRSRCAETFYFRFARESKRYPKVNSH